jgi:hypothetical protein
MSPARRVLNALTLMVAIGLLAGCFRSDKPLIDKAQASFPFEELVVKTEEGETAILRRDGDVYAYIDPAKPDRPAEKTILLHLVAEHTYVVQEAGAKGRSIFLFARRSGDKITTGAVCRTIDDAVLKTLGIERESGGGDFADCVAKDLNALVELAKTPDIWAKETKTLEIVSIK